MRIDRNLTLEDMDKISQLPSPQNSRPYLIRERSARHIRRKTFAGIVYESSPHHLRSHTLSSLIGGLDANDSLEWSDKPQASSRNFGLSSEESAFSKGSQESGRSETTYNSCNSAGSSQHNFPSGSQQSDPPARQALSSSSIDSCKSEESLEPDEYQVLKENLLTAAKIGQQLLDEKQSLEDAMAELKAENEHLWQKNEEQAKKLLNFSKLYSEDFSESCNGTKPLSRSGSNMSSDRASGIGSEVRDLSRRLDSEQRKCSTLQDEVLELQIELRAEKNRSKIDLLERAQSSRSSSRHSSRFSSRYSSRARPLSRASSTGGAWLESENYTKHLTAPSLEEENAQQKLEKSEHAVRSLKQQVDSLREDWAQENQEKTALESQLKMLQEDKTKLEALVAGLRNEMEDYKEKLDPKLHYRYNSTDITTPGSFDVGEEDRSLGAYEDMLNKSTPLLPKVVPPEEPTELKEQGSAFGVSDAGSAFGGSDKCSGGSNSHSGGSDKGTALEGSDSDGIGSSSVRSFSHRSCPFQALTLDTIPSVDSSLSRPDAFLFTKIPEDMEQSSVESGPAFASCQTQTDRTLFEHNNAGSPCSVSYVDAKESQLLDAQTQTPLSLLRYNRSDSDASVIELEPTDESPNGTPPPPGFNLRKSAKSGSTITDFEDAAHTAFMACKYCEELMKQIQELEAEIEELKKENGIKSALLKRFQAKLRRRWRYAALFSSMLMISVCGVCMKNPCSYPAPLDPLRITH